MGFSNNINMKEINLKTKSINVETKSRKIKYDCSRELVKDLSSFHGIDVESELVELLDTEIKVSIRKQNRKKKIENLTKHTD
jgi:hypothetical protein